MAARDIHGYVPGVKNLLEGGYQRADGSLEPSMNEKIATGRVAITSLQRYRELRASLRGKQPTALQQQQLDNLSNTLQATMPYFGYGYVKDVHQLVPYIPVCFYAFRAMVGLGSLFILFFIVVLFLAYRKDISRYRWLHLAGMAMLPLGYIASESGWLVAEFGRQPWAIQDMLPTWVGVSNVGSGSVMLTFFIFLALFTTLLAVEIGILWKQIKKGPQMSEQ